MSQFLLKCMSALLATAAAIAAIILIAAYASSIFHIMGPIVLIGAICLLPYYWSRSTAYAPSCAGSVPTYSWYNPFGWGRGWGGGYGGLGLFSPSTYVTTDHPYPSSLSHIRYPSYFSHINRDDFYRNTTPFQQNTTMHRHSIQSHHERSPVGPSTSHSASNPGHGAHPTHGHG